MARCAMLAACVIGAMWAAGCTSSTPPDSASSSLKSTVVFRYGVPVTGVFRWIFIDPDGSIRVVDKDATHTGQLAPEQVQDLAVKLQGWDRVAGNYPGIPDAPVWLITYDGSSASAGQGARSIPDQFLLVRSKIEYLSRQLAPTDQ